jgi:hypothetical protein
MSTGSARKRGPRFFLVAGPLAGMRVLTRAR